MHIMCLFFFHFNSLTSCAPLFPAWHVTKLYLPLTELQCVSNNLSSTAFCVTIIKSIAILLRGRFSWISSFRERLETFLFLFIAIGINQKSTFKFIDEYVSQNYKKKRTFGQLNVTNLLLLDLLFTKNTRWKARDFAVNLSIETVIDKLLSNEISCRFL